VGQLIGIAQGHYRNADRQVTQIVELQALVTKKEEIIAARDGTILHREDQINESDAMITQRNMIIEFLQEQIHDLILEVDDAHAHIDELQEQLVPPAVPVAPEGGEEDPEEIEGVFDLDSEHGDPEPNPQLDHSSSNSPPWATSTIFSLSKSSMWQNRSNYSGSSALLIAVQSQSDQRPSNGTILWPVGSPPDTTTVQQD
jgi:hypothetical protein